MLKKELIINKRHPRRFFLYKCRLKNCCNFIAEIGNSYRFYCNSHMKQRQLIEELREYSYAAN